MVRSIADVRGWLLRCEVVDLTEDHDAGAKGNRSRQAGSSTSGGKRTALQIGEWLDQG